MTDTTGASDDGPLAEPTPTALLGDETLVLPEFESAPDDPLLLAREWLLRAVSGGVREPWAASLATAGAAESGQGRTSRLDPRLSYRRESPGAAWSHARLQP